MVYGHHIIFGMYGFWLPNDPRGSWSDFVGAWELLQFGKATTTTARKSVAAIAHDRAARQAAKSSLKYPPVCLTGIQARAVGHGFSGAAGKSRFQIWACAIMADHVHLVVARHRLKAEQIANLLKGDATRELKRVGIHPLERYTSGEGRLPKAFAQGEWKVFLNSAEQIARAIRYVEDNPTKEGLPRQKWSFVQPFEGFD